jgi:hypothetical protein
MASTAETLEHGRNSSDTTANPMARMESFPGRVCDFLMHGTSLPGLRGLDTDPRRGVLWEKSRKKN